MARINIGMAFDSNRSIGSWLSNKATEANNKINDPIVRSGVGSIVNALDPQILGAGRVNDGNVFAAEYDKRARDLFNELQLQQSRCISASPSFFTTIPNTV